jgi:O-antigen/teichoic acid export membrane protein
VKRQAFFVVAGDGVTFAALFLTSMALARIISKEDMVTYRQVLYLGPLVISFADVGLSGAFYRFLPIYKGPERRVFLWDALLVTISLAAVASCFIAGAALIVPVAFHNAALGHALLITAAYPLGVMPFALIRPILICNGYSLKATLLETAFALATALAIILPLMAGFSLDRALGVWTLVNLLRIPAAGWYLIRELAGQRFTWAHGVAKEVWAYCWPIKLSQLPSVIINYFDKVATSIIFKGDIFAAYSLGARELPFLNSIPGSLSSVVIPKMVDAFEAGKIDRVCALWRKASLSTALVTYPLAAFAIWHSKAIIRLLFTATYDKAAIPFSFFAGITFLRVADYGSLAKALGNSHIILRTSIFGLIISMPLSCFMAFSWGLWGISASLLLSTAIIVVYYLVSYKRMMNRPLGDFFPFLHLVSLAMLAMASAILASHVARVWSWVGAAKSSIWLALQLGSIFALTVVFYGLGLLVIRHISPEVFAGIGGTKGWKMADEETQGAIEMGSGPEDRE